MAAPEGSVQKESLIPASWGAARSTIKQITLVLPLRKFSRLCLVVSTSLALIVIIIIITDAHVVSLSPYRLQEYIQANTTLPLLQKAPAQPHKDPADDAYNSTLGFEKVFYISMSYRTDRQDAMNLIAHSTNVKLTLEPGVNGKEMHPNALPESSSSLRPAQLGCWRAHANLWSRMLSEHITTALIVEDDADWDVNVHDNFALVARHMRSSNVLRGGNMTEYERKTAPYGLDWDILYVGHCWDNRNDSDPSHIHFIDPDAPAKNEMSRSYQTEIESYGYEVDDHTRQRLITNAGSPVCTIAYALTQNGAKKLLYNVGGYKGIDAPVDVAMASTVEAGLAKGVTVLPPLIVDFKLDEKSDINKEPVEEPIGPLQGTSENLRQSARKALAELGRISESQPSDEELVATSVEELYI